MESDKIPLACPVNFRLLRPVGGEILLDDRSIARLEAHHIAANGLALVPEGRQVFPELTVHDNLLLGAYTRLDTDLGASIEALLERFPRLRDRLHGRAGLLSGGEQQMLSIARGLMAKPRILLLDEPSLGLAPALINELFDILAELRDDGVTILLVDQMDSAESPGWPAARLIDFYDMKIAAGIGFRVLVSVRHRNPQLS